MEQQPLPLYCIRAIIIRPSTIHVVRETGDEAAERDLVCLYWAVVEWTGLSVHLIYMYIGNPVLPFAFSSEMDRTVCSFDIQVYWQSSPFGIQFWNGQDCLFI